MFLVIDVFTVITYTLYAFLSQQYFHSILKNVELRSAKDRIPRIKTSLDIQHFPELHKRQISHKNQNISKTVGNSDIKVNTNPHLI